MRDDGLFKYPRTPHLLGSRLQAGDSGEDALPYAALAGRWLVVEEKMDGANCGVSFSAQAQLQLQSRGHFLNGGSRERQFAVLHRWAQRHQDVLFDRLGDRYVLYAEWMAAKHSMFYDALPHLLLEFDVLDVATGRFLSTARRRALWAGAPVVAVPVLFEGPAPARWQDLAGLLGPSLGRSPGWREALTVTAEQQGLDVARVVAQTDGSDLAEGFYLKLEDDDHVLARAKWVRPSFTQTIVEGDGHWHRRPIVPNRLRPDVDLFSDDVPTDPWRARPPVGRSPR